ncbi:MAG: FAD:protein FMN transferase [Actinomycetales bacterium]|nr:FAD:protein FMN transferase [Actinomycetales bacterium]
MKHNEQQFEGSDVSLAESAGRAMGTSAQILVEAPCSDAAHALADLGLHRAHLLERCWSRFRDDSELNALNARAGQGPVDVSDDLALLVARMVDAWLWTQGAFDPTVLRSMVSLGYDVDFSQLATQGPSTLPTDLTQAPGMAGVRVIDNTVTLPGHVGIDPGGIGKGLASDIIASELLAAGATGVLVNLGGDARAAGTCQGEPWQIGIRDDRSKSSPIVAEFDMGDQGVATSSSLRRRWQGRHHLIDPNTGAPTASDVLQATVFAPTAWQAEAMATVALVRGQEAFLQWASSIAYSAYLFGPEGDPLVIHAKESINA